MFMYELDHEAAWVEANESPIPLDFFVEVEVPLVDVNTEEQG